MTLSQLPLPLSVLAVGTATAHPGPTIEALRAIAAERSAVRRHPRFVAPDGLPQLCAPVAGCLEEADAVERLVYLAQAARADLGPEADRADVTLLVLPAWMGGTSPFRDGMRRAVETGRLGAGRMKVVTGDAAAGPQALMRAADLLSENVATRVLLLAADTLIAPAVLDMAALLGRARTRITPYVPVPGEAGVALLLAREGGRHLIARIALDLEPAHPDDLLRGLMGHVSRQVIHDVADDARELTLLADLDGERYRAEEFGVIMSAMARTVADRIVVPPIAIGHIGAATAPLHVAVSMMLTDTIQHDIVSWVVANNGTRSALRLTQSRKEAIPRNVSFGD